MVVVILTLPYVVGAYMLLDSFEAIPGVKAQIRSPLIPLSSGCLDLTFHYYLYGSSTTMELSVHTMTAGRRCIYSDILPDRISWYHAKCMGWLEFVFLFVRREPWSCSIHHQGEPGTSLEACRGSLPGNCSHSGKAVILCVSLCVFVHILISMYS